MKFLIQERLSENRYKTPEGYLVCTNAILSRTGKQTYRRNEIFGGDDVSEIEIDRTPEEVFSPTAMASFENKPITVEHPSEDVTVENYSNYAVGYVRNIRKGEVNGQDVMLGDLIITDKQTIAEIEAGKHTDLSCGYDCDIKDDEHPQQKNIRGNHIALCQEGRAGIARIVDSKENEMDEAKAKAQMWIDYDMKKYGKVSDDTLKYLAENGLHLTVKNDEAEVTDSTYVFSFNGKSVDVDGKTEKEAFEKLKKMYPDEDLSEAIVKKVFEIKTESDKLVSENRDACDEAPTICLDDIHGTASGTTELTNIINEWMKDPYPERVYVKVDGKKVKGTIRVFWNGGPMLGFATPDKYFVTMNGSSAIELPRKNKGETFTVAEINKAVMPIFEVAEKIEENKKIKGTPVVDYYIIEFYEGGSYPKGKLSYADLVKFVKSECNKYSGEAYDKLYIDTVFKVGDKHIRVHGSRYDVDGKFDESYLKNELGFATREIENFLKTGNSRYAKVIDSKIEKIVNIIKKI